MADNKGIKIPQETIKNIVKMFEEGNTIGYIAKENEVHRNTVRKYIKEHQKND